MCNDNHMFMAVKLLVAGIVVILARLYTTWDIWIVLGAMLVLKGVLVFVMSGKSSEEPKDDKVKDMKSKAKNLKAEKLKTK